jgi:hypothetical protein
MEKNELNATDINTSIADVINLKGIENHRMAALHLQAAANNHLDAAKHHEKGQHDKAAQKMIAAHINFNLANKAQRADVKQHAITSL